MKMKKRNARFKIVLMMAVFGVVALSTIAIVSVKIISKRNTAPTAAQADVRGTFNVNEHFTDVFNNEKINGNRWRVLTSDGVKIAETPANNLNIIVPGNSLNGKAKAGRLHFKQTIGDTDDFAINVSMYKPIITGNGVGTAGIIFSSSDTGDDESVNLKWIVSGSISKLQMTIKATDGTTINSKSVDVQAAKLTMRLSRNKETYSAQYRIGSDDDNNFILIDSKTNPNLGAAGRLSVFSSNVGQDQKFPKVVSRIDNVTIAWYDPTKPDSKRTSLVDKFSDEVIDADRWTISKPTGTSIIENKVNNLSMSLSAGANDGKAKVTRLTTKEAIPQQKDFQLLTQIIKPIIGGDGIGRVGVQYITNGSLNDERASVIWEIDRQGANKLIFVTTKANGDIEHRKAIDLNSNVNRVVVRMVRNDKGYTAMYKIGLNDPDSLWKSLGTAKLTNSTGGKIQLFCSNVGTNSKYPKLVGRFDYFNLNYLK